MHRFVDAYQWLYASEHELEAADEDLDLQIAKRSGLIDDFDDDPAEPRPAPNLDASGRSDAPAVSPAAAGGTTSELRTTRAEVDARLRKIDGFPSGYFETADGGMVALRAVTRSSGMGDQSANRLMDDVTDSVAKLAPTSFHPAMQVGFAGDIPNAIAEKDRSSARPPGRPASRSCSSSAASPSSTRSPWSILIVVLPALVGVGCAYAFATATFGYVNTSGAFLGAIILGNGINYPIVLCSRYREFRARGMEPAESRRREAVLERVPRRARRRERRGIAYGSLDDHALPRLQPVRRRSASSGCSLVWALDHPARPGARSSLVERLQEKLPPLAPRLRRRQRLRRRGATARVARWLVARSRSAARCVFLAIAGVFTALAVVEAPRVPARSVGVQLRTSSARASRSSERRRRVVASRPTEVFGGKMNVAGALMLADTPEQVPLRRRSEILDNDAAIRRARSSRRSSRPSRSSCRARRRAAEAKLDVLERIRDRLTPRVLARHDAGRAEERSSEMKPPEALRTRSSRRTSRRSFAAASRRTTAPSGRCST